MTATAYFGMKSLTILSAIAVPAIAILGSTSAVMATNSVGGVQGLMNIEPTSKMAMVTAVTLCVGSFISGGTATPDFARFSKNKKVAVGTTVVAFFIGNSLMFLFGAVGAMVTGNSDIADVMFSQGLVIPAILVLGLNIWTTNEKYIPYCIEPSLGADRVALAFLVDAYDEEELEGGDVRTVMHLHPALAPYKAAVLPLSKKLSDKADEVYSMLAKKFNVEYDETGSIGKRYRRQDEIGTPFCITVDFETENDGCVTIRHRDSMTQERVEISKLTHFIAKSLEF